MNNDFDHVVDGMRTVAKRFIDDFQPLNRFAIDSYNRLVTQGLHDIMRRSTFYYSDTQHVYKVSFENLFCLPPFKMGELSPQDLEISSKDIYEVGKDNIRRVKGMHQHILDQREHWMTANDCRINNAKYLLSVYADIRIEQKYIGEKSFGINQNEEKMERLVQAFLPVIFAEAEVEPKITTKPFVRLFQIPLQTGSVFDWPIFAGVPPEQYSLFGECLNEPFASFVIKKNRIFITQEKLAPNIARCIKDNTGKVECNFRSESTEKRSVQIRIMFTKPKKGEESICTIYMPFLIRTKSTSEQKISDINVFSVLRFYALWAIEEHIEEILDEISEGDFADPKAELVNQVRQMLDMPAMSEDQFNRDLEAYKLRKCLKIMNADINFYLNQCTTSSEAYKQMVTFLIPTIRNAEEGTNEDFIKWYSEEAGIPDGLDYKHKIKTIKNLFDADLFPHINMDESDYDYDFENDSSAQFAPFYALMSMVVQFVKVYNGKKSLSDRNNFGTKQLATVGIELGTLIEKGFRKAIGLVRRGLTAKTTSIDDLPAKFMKHCTDNVTVPISSSFTSGNWGLDSRKPRTGVVIIEDPASMLVRWEVIRRVTIPTSSKSKIALPRLVQSTGYGIVDPTKTADSDKVGFIKYLAISVYISNNDVNAEQWAAQIARDAVKSNELFAEKEPNTLPLFINHTWQGFAKRSLFLKYKEEKLRGTLGLFTEVYESVEVDDIETSHEYHVLTTGGRAMRPVFTIGEGNKFLAEEIFNKYDPDTTPNIIEILLRNGAMQYISANEFEFCDAIAMDYKQFMMERDTRSFSYMEIDPSYALSVSGATMPDATSNPVPRVMYYGLMSHQPISIPFTTFQIRQEKDLKILNYTQKPLVSTDLINTIGLEQQGFGLNVRVFILPFAGSDEDATIWNRRFFDMGGFSSTLYETFTQETKALVPDNNDDITRYANGVVTQRKRVNDPNDMLRNEVDPAEREILEVPRTGAVGDSTFEEEAEEENEEEDEDEEQTFRTEEAWPIRGIPKIDGDRAPNLVRPGDVLIRYKTSMNNQAEVRQVTMKGRLAGFVHSTHQFPFNTSRMEKVTIRMPQIPTIVGNKFANRFAQKGISGVIMDEIDMPFISEGPNAGMTPDVIFSPMSFASRGTVGMFMEMLRGKAAAVCDMNHFVERLVSVSSSGVVVNTDFHLLLDYILVDKNEEPPVINVEALKTEIRNNEKLMEPYNQLTGDLLNKKIDELVEQMIDEDYESYERAYGLKFSEEVVRGGYAIGKKTVYEVPEEGHIATLRTGEKGILFSKLPEKLQFKYYQENKKRLIPAYRIVGAKDTTKLEQKLRDATPFRPLTLEEIQEVLAEKGYKNLGYETVRNGRTGEEMKALVFTGPCYWMALKHLVEKKEQVRDTGMSSLGTRSAIKGKAHGGAVKKEEMQRVVAIAHGANKFLSEAFLKAADEYKMIVCQTCGGGCYGGTGTDPATCQTCRDKIKPYNVTIPWATVKLMSMARAAGINIRLEVDAKEEDYSMDRNVKEDDPLSNDVNIVRLDDLEDFEE